MSEIIKKLANPPIVEAVLDIDCDMPPMPDWTTLKESAQKAYQDHYPHFQNMSHGTIQIEGPPGGPQTQGALRRITSLQFFQEDRKQLVQVRSLGYSFNRLAPYSTLDDYLPEIERTWKLFVDIAGPKLIRSIRLNYINRIALPITNQRVLIGKYFKVSPQLPDESDLSFTGFLNQHSAVENSTGNQANILLTALPNEADKLPIILDIAVVHREDREPDSWDWIAENVRSLRNLKNRIFKNTLSDVGLSLFQ